MRVGVAIPTYNRPGREEFLARALRSAKRQHVETKIVVAHNLGESRAPVEGVVFVESHGGSASENTNAAVRALDTEHIAILEDDDYWHPDHLGAMLEALRATQAAFASTSTLEVDTNGAVMRVHDFPVPSGWVMPKVTWDLLGGFAEGLITHQDNEFLGRLNEACLPRVHVIESLGPMTFGWAKGCRPGLALIENASRGGVRLARTTSPYPLVTKTIHPHAMSYSWTHGEKTMNEPELKQLVARFGTMPW